MRWWWLQVGQTFWFCSRSVLYRTLSQLGHLTHRPSGTCRRSAGSVCWILGGSSFSSQLMESSFGGAEAELCVERRPDLPQETGDCRKDVGSWNFLDQLDDFRADHDG